MKADLDENVHLGFPSIFINCCYSYQHTESNEHCKFSSILQISPMKDLCWKIEKELCLQL